MQFLSLAFAGVPPPVTYLVENKCQSELLSNQQAPLRLGNPAHHPYIGFPKEKRQRKSKRDVHVTNHIGIRLLVKGFVSNPMARPRGRKKHRAERQ